MKRFCATVTLICVAGLLAACANRSGTLPDYESQTPVGGAGSGTDTSTNALGGSGGIGVQEQGIAGDLAQQGLLSQLVIYFDFDTSTIAPEFNDVLAAHAHFLATHQNAKVRLEGNTDERGSREYNIGLGERRAQAVRQALLLQGASADQLTTVSYGEERPAADGHDDAAYKLNRRVEIVYEQ